ncbi:MAG: glycosyltransferase family 4 protein [Candidatus Omnitrophica bacterium]|nr:glycosyltransferase family 4 protein [Candidatus Omnitrophota bacterium]
MKKKRKRALNVSHLHWGFPPIIGGVETHLNIILPAMAKGGNKISIFTGPFEGYKGYYKYKGIEVYRAPIMDLNWLSKRGINGLEREIREDFITFIEKTNPDILHAHNMHYFSKPHARILEELSIKKGIPLVLTAHNSWDDNLFLDLTRKVKWARIIAVSHFIKRELIGVGVDDRKISVIHHGIDEKAYRPNINTRGILRKYPILKNKHVIFHPARMGLGKGCDVSIKALRLVKERYPDVVLILAGTKNIIDWGSQQQKDIAYMVNLVDFFRLRKNVLINAFKLSDMPALYAVSDVCLYPSTTSEPFGLTMLEAMASAKPMIITDTGGMPEIIKDGINGFVIPIKNFEMLASRIIQLLDDKRLNERFGYTGREIIEQYYTKDIVTRNIINLYKKLL